MSRGFAVLEVMYDQLAFFLSKVQAGQHQSCTHHSWHSIVQSLRICNFQNGKPPTTFSLLIMLYYDYVVMSYIQTWKINYREATCNFRLYQK